MATLYAKTAEKHGWGVDAALLARMQAANAAKVAEFDAGVVNAREKFGDVEVLEQQRLKAECLASVGDRAAAMVAYGALAERVMSTGQKIDVAMAKARLALQHADWADAKARISEAKALNEVGGDWDRRNRLKVYEGLHALAVRDFKLAAELLLSSVATFTATEVLTFESFVSYTVIASLKSLDRVSLKKQVVDAPDILSILRDLPLEGNLLNAFYECRYRDFLQALVDLHATFLRNRYLYRHAAFYLREMRLAAYVQFLESYKSYVCVWPAVAAIVCAHDFLLTPCHILTPTPFPLLQRDGGGHGAHVWRQRAVPGQRAVALHCGGAHQRQD